MIPRLRFLVLLAVALAVVHPRQTWRVPLLDECAREVARIHPVIAHFPNPHDLPEGANWTPRPLTGAELAARTALRICRFEAANPAITAEFYAALAAVEAEEAAERELELAEARP